MFKTYDRKGGRRKKEKYWIRKQFGKSIIAILEFVMPCPDFHRGKLHQGIV
jgi:hypothetical protein